FRLGVCSEREAADIADKIDRLIRLSHQPNLIGSDALAWAGQLADKPYQQLVDAGVLPPREAPATIAAATTITLDVFLNEVATTVKMKKESTRASYGHTWRCLRQFFGKDRDIRTISAKDADTFHAWLATNNFARLSDEEERKPRRLVSATVSRRMICARHTFKNAIRWKLIEANPFVGIKVSNRKQTNPKRKVYVPRENIEKVLTASSDREFRLMVALSRFGGLRCPSEHLSLTWDDVHWGGLDESTGKEEPGRIIIRSPKTEHNTGGESRTIPLFKELRPYIQDVFDGAETGVAHVITVWRGDPKNLRTRMKRTILAAGLTPWPRLFHNLRGSCETDLVKEYPITTVAEWIGHNPAIMVQHYLTNPDLDADFARASIAKTEASDNDKSTKTDMTRIPTRAVTGSSVELGSGEIQKTAKIALETQKQGYSECSRQSTVDSG
ncbi:MAG: site-specific integrase, partial [Phycisphaerales bacterium]|nr:site-specific integrase [Phycisphaerales bacterium]